MQYNCQHYNRMKSKQCPRTDEKLRENAEENGITLQNYSEGLLYTTSKCYHPVEVPNAPFIQHD